MTLFTDEEASMIQRIRRWGKRCARRVRRTADAGMTTVEYAIGTVVAAALAAVLYKIVTGDSIVAGLTNLVQSALSPQW
jgi:hypothetical protein